MLSRPEIDEAAANFDRPNRRKRPIWPVLVTSRIVENRLFYQ